MCVCISWALSCVLLSFCALITYNCLNFVVVFRFVLPKTNERMKQNVARAQNYLFTKGIYPQFMSVFDSLIACIAVKKLFIVSSYRHHRLTYNSNYQRVKKTEVIFRVSTIETLTIPHNHDVSRWTKEELDNNNAMKTMIPKRFFTLSLSIHKNGRRWSTHTHAHQIWIHWVCWLGKRDQNGEKVQNADTFTNVADGIVALHALGSYGFYSPTADTQSIFVVLFVPYSYRCWRLLWSCLWSLFGFSFRVSSNPLARDYATFSWAWHVCPKSKQKVGEIKQKKSLAHHWVRSNDEWAK